MDKFVFFNYGDGYQKCIINAIENDEESCFFHNFEWMIFKKIFFFHNAWKINDKFEMPFKSLWFNRVLKNIDISEQDKVYFLLYESFHLTYSKSFLKFLKVKYPNSKLCYMFSNPADNYNQNKIRCIEKNLDAIITFNKKDADEYGYQFCPIQPYKVFRYNRQSVKESDLFFIGKDKGRLDKLIEIFEYLSDKNIKCDFYIVDVPKEKQKYADKIHYNRHLSYEEVLEKVVSTNCVLELLQNSENYISVRTIEAMQYHTKLLTSNSSVKNYSFYNENIIQVFNETECIQAEFIKKRVEENQYPDESFASLETFKQYLLNNIN